MPFDFCLCFVGVRVCVWKKGVCGYTLVCVFEINDKVYVSGPGKCMNKKEGLPKNHNLKCPIL